jgi:hypothetical protein
MPVIVKGIIDAKKIEVVVKDGTVLPFFLEESDLKTIVVIGSEDDPKYGVGMHLVALAGLWFHRKGLPMGELERRATHYLKPGEDKFIDNNDIVTITNPHNIENVITASYMSPRSKR